MFSCTRGAVRHLIISTLLPLTSCWFNAQAQDTIKLSKIDPPNWWAAMPKPMLLVQGEHLDGARFRLSDRSLHLDRTIISPNGHWAELWLASINNTISTCLGRRFLLRNRGLSNWSWVGTTNPSRIDDVA